MSTIATPSDAARTELGADFAGQLVGPSDAEYEEERKLFNAMIDNLLGADLVLADGQQVVASADENPDLFWAIRGGGGNFGVVTTFHFQAHPVATVVGGPTFWAIEEADDVLKAYREFLPAAP